MVANLPYNVAVPVLLNLLARLPSLRRGLVMVQAEVAERMCAGPGARVYGTPSAKLAWYARGRLAGPVPRSVFWPVPGVDSVLVAFDRTCPPAVRGQPRGGVRRHRRRVRPAPQDAAGRTGQLAGSAAAAEQVIRRAGLDPGARGEALSVAKFARIGRGPRWSPGPFLRVPSVNVTGVTVRAPAKINLQLAVGPLRDDGYHDLVTVFQAVSLYDEVTAATVDGSGDDQVLVSGEGADSVQAGPDNLALKAATALAQVAVPSAPGAHITIVKRIPVAAGLAGGGGDAAGPGRVQRALERPPRPAAAAGDRGPGRQRRGLLAARRDRGGPGPGRAAKAGAGLRWEYHWVLAVADGQLSTPEVYRTLDRLRESGRPARGARSRTGRGLDPA